MKWRAIIVLAAITLSIVAPPSLPMFMSQDVDASIGTLDVCSSTTPALSSTGDMPCMNETICDPETFALFSSFQPENNSLKLFGFAFQVERPPRI